MAKIKKRFVCSSCGYVAYKWAGRCSGCGEWETLNEELETPKSASNRVSDVIRQESSGKPVKLGSIDFAEERRRTTGISEFDRVLGGGIVAGSVILVGGEPGIGKSTLLLQVAGLLGRGKHTVLYCTGEESLGQVGMRAKRLEVESEGLLLVTDTQLESLVQHVRSARPDCVIVDSIQTLSTSQLTSSPGSVTQLREVTAALTTLAKSEGIAMFLVGHVTKDGAIAGPKLLEHMVDTVLYFEGQNGVPFRVIRAVKNRFGSTNEIGVFEMRHKGLREVPNPSGLFLAERPEDAAGSAVVCTMEGSRPLLAEIQALISPNSYGPPRVTAIGVDTGRVLMMLNIIERTSGLKVTGHDVFVNVAGGVKLDEPAADLAIIAALISSKLDMPLPRGAVIFGEVGLTGEVRAVGHAPPRLSEVAKLGFDLCVLARGNVEALRSEGERLPEGVRLGAVAGVPEAIRVLFGES